LLDPGALLVSEGIVTRMTTAELRAAVRGTPSPAGSAIALAELVAREPRGLNRLLVELALDARTDQALRLTAVAALGRNVNPSSLEGLRAALGAGDEEVERRAIERLGKVGTPADLELLRPLRTGNRTTQRVLRAAKSFLSYRHRLGRYRVDDPKNHIAADIRTAAPIRTTTPTAKMINRLELRPPPVPGIALQATPLRRLLCGRDEFSVFITDEFVGAAAATVAERQGVLAVVARYNNEIGADTPAYYLLADPTGRGRFRLVGMRGSGRIGLAGSGEVAGGQLRFEVNATETPLEHPLTIAGSYNLERGVVRFELAVVEARFSERQQRLRKQPSPVRQRA
jgi:HEAT repeats